MKGKNAKLLVISAIIFAVIILMNILPLYHGHFVCETSIVLIDKSKVNQYIICNEKHANAVAILMHSPTTVSFQFDNKDGSHIIKETVDKKQLESLRWHYFYLDNMLKEKGIYKVKAKGEDNQINIYFAFVKAMPIFSNKAKVVLSIVGISFIILLTLSGELYCHVYAKLKEFAFAKKLVILYSLAFIIMVYVYHKEGRVEFERSSENLVAGVIQAAKLNALENRCETIFAVQSEDVVKDDGKLSLYNLGLFMQTSGIYDEFEDRDFITNTTYLKGYNMHENRIIVANNGWTKLAFARGNYIVFAGGQVAQILNSKRYNDATTIGQYLSLREVELGSGERLNYDACGSLKLTKLYDKYGHKLPSGMLATYTSQYGLQGAIFRRLALLLPAKLTYKILHFICIVALCMTLSFVGALIYKKYGKLLAFSFYIISLLSPYLQDFSSNLYWVISLWFVPVILGLLYSLYYQKSWQHAAILASCFLAFMIKCLCGYEYITTIMISAVTPMAADTILAIIRGDISHAKKTAIHIALFATCAVAGFFAALILHASLGAGGSILSSIKKILSSKLVGYLTQPSMNTGFAVLEAAKNASIIDILTLYLTRDKLSFLIMLLPLLIFVLDGKMKRLNLEDLILYFCYFIASISWYVMVRVHSYFHTFSYVLWYMGFMQVCFYILLKAICRFIKKDHN